MSARRVDREAELPATAPHPLLRPALVEQDPLRVGSIPSTMFSATVITGMSMKCWCTIPIPASIASLAEANVTCLPLSRISPASGL